MGGGAREGLAEVGLWAGWAGWAGWLADCEQRRLFAGPTCCQVVTMRVGWSWLEGVREGKHTAGFQRRRREARMKLSMRKWINPDEADDNAASKFLCGGGQLVAA